MIFGLFASKCFFEYKNKISNKSYIFIAIAMTINIIVYFFSIFVFSYFVTSKTFLIKNLGNKICNSFIILLIITSLSTFIFFKDMNQSNYIVSGYFTICTIVWLLFLIAINFEDVSNVIKKMDKCKTTQNFNQNYKMKTKLIHHTSYF